MTRRRPLPQAPPGLWDRPDMAAALDERDMGAVLRIYRQWTGASQPQIATMTGVPQPTISTIINDKRKVISLDIFERFATGLDIPRDRLGLADDTPTPDTSPADDSDVSAARPKTVEDGVGALTSLWRADLRSNGNTGPSLDPNIWTAAALDWLLHSADRVTRAPSTGRRVGAADIDAVRSTAKVFADLDNRYGGGHARQALISFLSTDVDSLLRGRYSTETGRKLYSAVAETTLLAAWMAYDTGAHGLAQRYFVQALHLAQTAGDRMLAGSVLDAMSHQATYLGRFRHATDLARAAVTGTIGATTPTLTAHFHAMEARALARLGDAAACDAALSAAERAFADRRPEDDPPWFAYVDEAELSAEFGHCFRDLGRADGARTWAARSVEATTDGGLPRSDFFATMVLADAHLDRGDPEPACTVALDALRMGDQLKSARCAQYVREFRDRLTKLSTSRIVRDFTEQAASHRLWVTAA